MDDGVGLDNVNDRCPQIILILSGKRKSGKDFIAEIIKNRCGVSSCIVRLSSPLKEQYAKENKLDFAELLTSSVYKERCRADMIQWGEIKRNENPGFFCELATENKNNIPVWLISDARRKTDINYFQMKYMNIVKTVQITADMTTRQSRGFEFVTGIDDAESECGLDDMQNWDFVVSNNGNKVELDFQINKIMKALQQHI